MELKPCPFCGSKGVLVKERHIPSGWDFTPRCTNPSCPGRISKKWKDGEYAVMLWNRRADQSADEQREAVKWE